jgi:hypothetical protein
MAATPILASVMPRAALRIHSSNDERRRPEGATAQA